MAKKKKTKVNMASEHLMIKRELDGRNENGLINPIGAMDEYTKRTTIIPGAKDDYYLNNKEREEAARREALLMAQNERISAIKDIAGNIQSADRNHDFATRTRAVRAANPSYQTAIDMYMNKTLSMAAKGMADKALNNAEKEIDGAYDIGTIKRADATSLKREIEKRKKYYNSTDRQLRAEERNHADRMAAYTGGKLDYEYTQKYAGKSYKELKSAAERASDEKEKEWLNSYAESIKKPEDYDSEIDEKRKKLRSLEAEYGYDTKTGKLRSEDSFVDRKGRHERNADRKKKLDEINAAKEDLGDTIRKKDKLKDDLKRSAFYESLKKEPDYGIYANKDLPDGYYASDSDTKRTAVGQTAQIPIPGTGINPVVTGQDPRNDPSADVNQNAQFMKDDEKRIFNYLYHKYGPEKADEYRDFIQDELNYRRGSALAAKTGGSYPEALISDFAFGVERGSIGAVETLLNDIAGSRALPKSASEYAVAMHADKYKDYGPKLLGRSLGQWGLESSVNIGNMMPSIAVSGAMGAGAAAGSLAAKAAQIAGAGIMGVGAGANTMNEAWREGADKKSAAIYGTVNGLSEAALQYYLGGIAKQGGKISGITKDLMKDKLKHTWSRALFNIGSDMLSEGTEEYLQEVLDPTFRNYILGENNELKFFSEDALYAGLQGAFTSLLMSGPGNIAAARSETYFNRLGRKKSGNEDFYVSEAERRGLSDSLKKYNESEKTKTDFGQLVNDVDQARSIEAKKAFFSGIGEKYSDRTQDIIEAAAFKNMNAVIDNYNNSEKSDYDLGVLVSEVHSAIGSDILNAKSMDKAMKAYEKVTEGAPEYVKEVADNALGERIGAEIKNAETMEEAQSIYNDNVSEEASDVIRQKADDAMSERQIEDARERANEVNGIDDMSDNTKNIMTTLEEKVHSEDAKDFRNAFAYYYAYGRAGVQFEATRDSNLYGNILTQREKELANNQGLEDRNESLKRINPNRKTDGIVRAMKSNEITEGMRSSGIRELRDGEVNNDQNNAIRGYAAIHGFDVIMYGSDKVDGKNKAANGWYDPNTNTIYLNMSKKDAGKRAAMMILAHEFTHSLKYNATEQYKMLADYIIKTFQSDSSLDVLVDLEMEAYENRGIKISPEKAMDEVIAEACQELFKNSEEVVRLAKSDPGIANKIKDFINEFIQSIKNVLRESEPTSLEAKHLKKLLGDLTEVQKLYDDAIKASATREFNENENLNEMGETSEKKSDTDTDEEVYFSFDNDVELSDGFVAFHNLYLDQLIQAIKMGGLIMPSSALTQLGVNLDKYGNVTLILSRPMVDPEMNESVRLYAGDAWTPTFPEMKARFNEDVLTKASKEFGIEKEELKKIIKAKKTEKEIIDTIKDNSEIKRAFVEKKNYSGRMLPHFIDMVVKDNRNEYDVFLKKALNGIIDSLLIKSDGEVLSNPDATIEINGEKYIPATFENILNSMMTKPESSKFIGVVKRMLGSVEEAKSMKNRIINDSGKATEISKKMEAKAQKLFEKILKNKINTKKDIEDIEKAIIDILSNNRTKEGFDKETVFRDIKNKYPRMTRTILDEMFNLIDEINKSDVLYFEAKTRGIVSLSDRYIGAAVLPQNIPKQIKVMLKNELKKCGIEVVEYNTNVVNDQFNKANKWAKDNPDEYVFSLPKETSTREVLADALETATQTDEERKLLKDYKSEIKQLETLEFLVGEMEKAAESAKTAEERDGCLRKAEIYRKAIQNTDKSLLELEATEPLKNVLNREIKARQDEGVEALKKRYAAREERKRMTVLRNRIKDEIAGLVKSETKPTKKDYVPDVLKKTVGDFIQSIDFVSRYADPNSWNTEQWRAKMYNLASVLRYNAIDGNETGQGDTAVGMDPTMFDPDLLRQIDTFIKNHEGENISDLDSAALTDLYIITRKLRMGIRNYNRMFTNKRFESAERAGYETIEMLDEKKTRSRKRDIGIIRVLDKLFNVDMLEPKSYFKRFGKAGESIYEAIAEGDDRNKSVLQDASEYVAGVYKRLGIDAKTVRKWGGRKAKQSFDIRGNNITLTPLQIMTLYELSKREQAMRHINRGGIIVQGEDVISVNEKDPSGKQTNEGEKAVTLFNDDVKMITDTLTDEQKAFADELQKWMANEGAAYGNEVSMKMYGSKNFTEQNYFPIKTDSNSRNASTNEDSGNTNLYRILNLGMTKTVDETARNAVIITDIMSAFSEHVADMASYYGYAMPIADAMKWFNYRYDIGHATKSVRGEMDRVFGTATQQYFKTLLADINGNTALNNDNLFDALIGHYKAAAVGANIRVVIQQPIAYIRALNVMNPKYLAKAIKSKNNIEEMEKYAPIAWWKDSSFRENGKGKSLKSTLTNDMTWTEGITDFLTKPAGWADKVTWGKLWNAVKYEIKDKYGDMEYEDFMDKCAKRFRQIVDESQVVDTKLSRSQLMRNKNGLTKLATAFMMEPTKTYNMLYDAYTSKDAKKIARATAVWALENIVLIAVKSAYDSFRRLNWSDDEKEKDYLQRFLDSAKTNAADEFIPLNMIPFLKEIPGAFETIFSDNDNTRAQRFDMQWLYDLADAVKKNKKFYSGDYNEKDMWKAQESILKLLSNVSGVPISNLYREAKTIKNSVQYQFMGQETIHEQIRRAAQYKYDGEFDKYKEERKKILEERYVLGNKKITSDEFVKMVDSEFAKIKKEAVGENAEEDKDEFEQDKAMYKIGDAKKAVSDGNYRYVQEILDEIYDAGHPVTEEQKADYFESKAKSFKSSLGKLLYKDPEDKDGDGKISDEEKKNKVLSDDYEKKKKEYLKLRIDGKPLFDEDYFLNIEKKDRKNGLDASLEAAGKSADIGASAQSIQSVITEMYNAEKPDERKAEVDYMKNKKQSIKSALTTYYKSQPADVRARLKVIYKKLYISGSKIKLYDNNSFVTMEKDIKAKEKAEKKTG